MTDQEVAMDADKPDPADKLRDKHGKHWFEDQGLEIVRAVKRDYLPDMDSNDGGQILMWILDLCDEVHREAKDAAERSLEEAKADVEFEREHSKLLANGLHNRNRSLEAAESQLSALRGALEDALIVTRNYYAQAISRSELEEHQDKWKATLLLAAQGTKEQA